MLNGLELAHAIASLPRLCGGCGKDHKRDRRGWKAAERARVAYLSHGSPPLPAGDPLPTYAWSVYECVQADRCERFQGPLPALARHLEWLNGQSAVEITGSGKPDKNKGPFYAPLSRANGRSTDASHEATTVVWFDCDGVGTPDRLVAELQRSGLAAIVAQSNGRKDTTWHVGIPLAAALQAPAGTTPEEWKPAYAAQYAHVAAILSAMAGFPGVGGKCGLDLATDRLIQPMFPAVRGHGPYAEPGYVFLAPGTRALDWQALLQATGYFEELYLATLKKEDLELARQGREVKLTLRRPSSGEPLDLSKSSLGPLGKALQAAGALGRAKDAAGVACYCPFEDNHTRKTPTWDAVYFPSSDKWWCPHTKCRDMSPSRLVVATALGPIALEAYQAALDGGLPPPAARAPAARGWLEKEIAENKAVDPAELVAAVIATKLKAEASLLDVGMAEDMAGVLYSRAESRDLVLRTSAQIKAGKRVRGATFLRQRVSMWRLTELSEALLSDSGGGLLQYVARKILGAGSLAHSETSWMSELAKGLAYNDKAKKPLGRPGWCRSFKDRVKAMGEAVGELQLVCETGVCPSCFWQRTRAEAVLALEGWESVPGWDANLTLTVHWLTGFASWDDVTGAIKYLGKQPGRKLRFTTLGSDKRPALMVVATAQDSPQVNSTFAYYRRKFGLTYKSKILSPQQAMNEAVLAKTRLHAYQRDLIANRDQAGLVEWIRWSKGRQFVRGGHKGEVRWPSKKVMRAALSQNSKLVIPDGVPVTYTLVHAETDTEIHVQDFPHRLEKAIEHAHHSSRLQADLEGMARDGDREEELAQEARMRDLLAATGSLTGNVYLAPGVGSAPWLLSNALLRC